MIRKDMMQIAKEMVAIPSINGTMGERKMGDYIESFVRSIPYFKKHPDQVISQELSNDNLHRKNVIAILIGEKENSGKTLIFNGHMDTVGLEGFGAVKEYAFSPDLLKEKLKEMQLPEQVKEDLLSDDYFFGRGSCDMKSGDAVTLGILKDACEHPELLSGNIVVCFNPVEENLHTGILEAVDILLHMKEIYHLDYVMAINNDYICPLFPDDEMKTIYTGTVGKLLPCFYIQGKETHVGQCFEGLDASLLATGLVNKIHLNHRFSDEYEGEYSYPPSVLKVKDLKPWYNVQTATEAFVYFNYFVHNASIEEITKKLLNAAVEVFDEVRKKTYEEADWFSKVAGQHVCSYEYENQVYTYDQLYRLAKEKKEFNAEDLKEILQLEIQKGTDKREIPIALIRYLLQVSGIVEPTIVLYYAAPYCPHNTIQGKDIKLIEDISKIASDVTDITGDSYRIMKFFPSLSDSSYFRIDDSDLSLQFLENNFPGFNDLYPLPIKKIKNLDIPTVNYGCYGKDAHKWTERVNIPYTFGTLPILMKKTIDWFLK